MDVPVYVKKLFWEMEDFDWDKYKRFGIERVLEMGDDA